MTKQRADRLLVTRGLFESRVRARAATAAGLVRADGVRVRKASDEISDAAAIEAIAEHPYVSRGGVKLAAALDRFGLDLTGRICLDVGASTDGFTEVLLERGARRVYAVDVGRGQLHPRLRGNGKIIAIEQTDTRALDDARLADRPDFCTIDVGFISLKLVVPAIEKLLQGAATLAALIKPQFEAGRSAVKKGIVRDPSVHAVVCEDIETFLIARGWRAGGTVPSPIRGGDGNREFLIRADCG